MPSRLKQRKVALKRLQHPLVSSAPRTPVPTPRYVPPKRYPMGSLPIGGGNPNIAQAAHASPAASSPAPVVKCTVQKYETEVDEEPFVPEVGTAQDDEDDESTIHGGISVNSEESNEDATAAIWSQCDPDETLGAFGDDEEAEYDGTIYTGSTHSMTDVYKARILSTIQSTAGMRAEDLIDTDLIPMTESNEPEDEMKWGALLLKALASLVEYTTDVKLLNRELHRAVQRRRHKGESNRTCVTHVTVQEAIEKLQDRSLVQQARMNE